MSRTRVLWAGLLGGALAGAGDALSSTTGALLQATRWNLLHLLGLGCALGAALGLGIACLAVLASRGFARLPKLSASLTAMTVAAPLVVYDAFALFSGAKASRIPAHQAISVAIIVLVLALVGFAAHVWRRYGCGDGFTTEDTEDTETEGRAEGKGRSEESACVPVSGSDQRIAAGATGEREARGVGRVGCPSRSPLGVGGSGERERDAARDPSGRAPLTLSHTQAANRLPPTNTPSLTLSLTPTKARAPASDDVSFVARIPVLRARLMVLALLLLGAGAQVANRRVLPRLYSWFHLSLALLTVVACVLAVMLLARRRGRAVLLVGVLIVVGLGSFELVQLGRSQSLRFFAFEKTQIVKHVVRLLPARQARPPGQVADVAASPVSGLPEGPHRPGADVVLITVDATRADHVNAYGYGRPTTPNIDALAQRGVRFERAYAQAPHTSFSIASLLTGTYYATLARLAPNGQHETLPHIFRRYGWKTAAFFPPAVFFIDAHKMKNFENSNFDFEYVKYEYLDAQQRIDQIEAFLRQEDPRKLFLWLHLFEPHEPYQAHPGHDFGGRDIDRYDSEIAFCDEVVGKVIALIQRRRPNSIVIVAADHGEEFDEHGGRYHGTTLYDEQVRVPLVMFVPGVSPRVVPGPVQLIDIAPTILGLLDLLPPVRMRGTDLGPWLATPPAPADRFPPVFSEVEEKRMVVAGQEKLVCDLAKDYCAFFDLATDPREQHDLAEAEPQKVSRLRQLIDGWLAQQARLATAGPADNSDEAQTIERARLGDASVAAKLAAMLTSPAPLSLRRQAARVLVEALPPKPETKDALQAALEGANDDEIRDWAAVAALRVGEGAGKARALAIVSRETDESLRLHAALALAQAGDGAGVKVLGAALDECATREALCKTIVIALGKLRDHAAVPALLDHLTDVRTRLEAVQALGEIGAPAAVPALIERLKTDEYVPVRIAAAQGLARIGGARALLSLQWSASHDPEPRVSEATKRALGELRRRK